MNEECNGTNNVIFTKIEARVLDWNVGRQIIVSVFKNSTCPLKVIYSLERGFNSAIHMYTNFARPNNIYALLK